MKTALITGITGQDGSYLAELLLEKGYMVYGMVRRSSTDNTSRIAHLLDHPAFMLIYGDLTDSKSLVTLLEKTNPDEIYNLAAQSDVGLSFKLSEMTGDVTGLGVLRLLEAIRTTRSTARFYQASSSELFGKVLQTPQNEETPFNPRSPYGVAKLYGHWITKNYRDSYGIHASNGILFNHESPRRGENFVTQKIVKAMVRIFKRQQDTLYLGNMMACRDWGYAGDYVKAMHAMLQRYNPGDYVVATGETHSIAEFVQETGALLGIPVGWRGRDKDMVGINTKTGEEIVKVNPDFYRPADVELLVGDASKAKLLLDWEPSVKFKGLVKIMVEAELLCYSQKD